MSLTVAEMQQRVAAGLSIRSRAGYTLLLVASIAMTGVTGSLLASESSLPDRTRLALGLMTLIGAAWAVLAGWVLARRQVLFAAHRIAAATLAIVASSVFLAGAVAFRTRLPASAIGVAAVMLLVAIGAWFQAWRYRARLMARRDALSGTRS
jgi:hypothetical protein